MVDYDYEILVGTLLGTFIGLGIYLILTIIMKWILFKKANKPGWAAIIPIYNVIVLFEVADIDLWQVILMFIPIANIYIVFKLYIELSKKFGKGTLFGIFTTLFPVIGLAILAFSSCKYEGATETEKEVSILDVSESGVPNSSELEDFSYGYEKEATVVMDPVIEEQEENIDDIIEEITDEQEENNED